MTEPAAREGEGRLRRLVRRSVALYAAGVVAGLGLAWLTGDRLAPVTAFAQLAHVATLPALVLLPVAWWLGSRRSLAALGVAVAGAAWFWGPWLAPGKDPPGERGERPALTVLTWNLGYGLADVDATLRVVRAARPTSSP